MRIIEYNNSFLKDVRDLLVELEEYIVSIDEDQLDQIHPEYREKMALIDLKKLENNNGKCYLAVENKRAIGLIMGLVIKRDEFDYLDYKCPKEGEIIELVVSKDKRGKGIGNLLIKKMEDYLATQGCEYIYIDVFSYNKNAMNFYKCLNYHSRMNTLIKKVE